MTGSVLRRTERRSLTICSIALLEPSSYFGLSLISILWADIGKVFEDIEARFTRFNVPPDVHEPDAAAIYARVADPIGAPNSDLHFVRSDVEALFSIGPRKYSSLT